MERASRYFTVSTADRMGANHQGQSTHLPARITLGHNADDMIPFSESRRYTMSYWSAKSSKTRGEATMIMCLALNGVSLAMRSK